MYMHVQYVILHAYIHCTLKICPSINFPSRLCSSFSNGLSCADSTPYSAGAPLMEVTTLAGERQGAGMCGYYIRTRIHVRTPCIYSTCTCTCRCTVYILNTGHQEVSNTHNYTHICNIIIPCIHVLCTFCTVPSAP